MKKTIKSLLIVAAALFAFSACTEVPAVDDLEGIHTASNTYEMNSLLAEERVQGEKVHTFNLLLATEGVTLNGENLTGSGAALSLKLLCNKSELASQSYSPAEAAAGKNGNYLIGEGGSQILIVENGTTTPKDIEKGTITVDLFNGKYNIYGYIWLTDKSSVRFESTVEIPEHEALLIATKLTKVLSVNNYGFGFLTINLGTKDTEYIFVQEYNFGYVGGTGNYIALDIYTPDGFLYEGTYTPSAQGGTVGEGEYGIGYDNPDWNAYNYGTCWWTANGGNNTAQKILEGNIEVTKKNGKYTISYLHGDIWFEFTGAIEAVDPDAGSGDTDTDTIDYEELDTFIYAECKIPYGWNTLTFYATTDGLAGSAYNGWGGLNYVGSGNALSVDVHTADGKLYTGTYAISATAGVTNAGEFGQGYDNESMFAFNWGTCWSVVEDGVATTTKVLDGELDVLVEGDNLVVKLRSTVVNAKMIIPVADFKDGQGNAIEVVNNAPATPEEPEYEELTNLLVSQVNADWSTGSPVYYGITIKAGTEGITYTQEGWNPPVYTGTGNFLSVDIYTADGKLHAGSYVANTEGGVLAEGQFGIGYDHAMFGANCGTCWWTVTDGATSAVKVLDGTMEVEVDGDNLVITLESEVVNTQMIVPVADLTFEVIE